MMAACVEIVNASGLEQPDLSELEFEDFAIEWPEEIFGRSFDDRPADFTAVGLFGADEHDGLAPPAGAADASDELGRRHSAKPLGSNDDIGHKLPAVPERRIGGTRFRELEAIFP